MVSGFIEFSLERASIRSLIDGRSYGAYFKLDQDVRDLFPYINAMIPDARYFDQPESIQFLFDDIQSTLYPLEVVAAPFQDRNQALAFFSHLVDFLNDLHNKQKDLRPDHRIYRPLSVIDVLRLLPKSNCGVCGYSTCLAFAAALRQGKSVPDLCPGFSAPIYENAVYPIFNRDGSLASTITIEINPTKRRQAICGICEPVTPSLSLTSSVETSRDTLPESKPAISQPPLTGREIQVLRLVAEGATNTTISEVLAISPHTVKSHIIHIFNKLGVNDRTQAAVWAAHRQLI